MFGEVLGPPAPGTLNSFSHNDAKLGAGTIATASRDRTELVIGDVANTAPELLKRLVAHSGFVVLDLDYYSSTKAAMSIFEGQPDQYLPIVPIYVADIYSDLHNSCCGELLAIV